MISTSILDKKGETPHFWGRMKEVQPNDIIFHYVRGEIIAISTTTSDCYEDFIPYQTDEVGYIVKTNYLELEQPIIVKKYFDEIKSLQPVKYAAFQDNGDGNQGYLYPCNEMLAFKLLEILNNANIYLDTEEQLELAIGSVIKKERNELGVLLSTAIHETHLKISRTQIKYKQALHEKWNHQCAICQLDLPELLKATYSKPWKDCTMEEKVDPMNGLLLCANHEILYTSGFIAFDGTGKIHIASELAPDQYEKLAIAPNLKVHREEQHKPYYKWHKKHIFKD